MASNSLSGGQDDVDVHRKLLRRHRVVLSVVQGRGSPTQELVPLLTPLLPPSPPPQLIAAGDFNSFPLSAAMSVWIIPHGSSFTLWNSGHPQTEAWKETFEDVREDVTKDVRGDVTEEDTVYLYRTYYISQQEVSCHHVREDRELWCEGSASRFFLYVLE